VKRADCSPARLEAGACRPLPVLPSYLTTTVIFIFGWIVQTSW